MTAHTNQESNDGPARFFLREGAQDLVIFRFGSAYDALRKLDSALITAHELLGAKVQQDHRTRYEAIYTCTTSERIWQLIVQREDEQSVLHQMQEEEVS